MSFFFYRRGCQQTDCFWYQGTLDLWRDRLEHELSADTNLQNESTEFSEAWLQLLTPQGFALMEGWSSVCHPSLVCMTIWNLLVR